MEQEGEEMFIGEYRHSLDPKGRIIVPSKFRDGLGYKFVLTKGLDGCLFAYSKDEWENLENKLKQLNEKTEQLNSREYEINMKSESVLKELERVASLTSVLLTVSFAISITSSIESANKIYP